MFWLWFSLALYGSQLFVYLICKFIRKRLNRWVSLLYVFLNIYVTITWGFLILFVAAMSNGAVTKETKQFATILVTGSAIIFLVIFILSIVNTFKSFKEYRNKEN